MMIMIEGLMVLHTAVCIFQIYPKVVRTFMRAGRMVRVNRLDPQMVYACEAACTYVEICITLNPG